MGTGWVLPQPWVPGKVWGSQGIGQFMTLGHLLAWKWQRWVLGPPGAGVTMGCGGVPKGLSRVQGRLNGVQGCRGTQWGARGTQWGARGVGGICGSRESKGN